MGGCKVHIQLFCSPHVTSNDLIQGCVVIEVTRETMVRAIAVKLEGVASTYLSIGPYSTHNQKYKELYQKFELMAPVSEPVVLKKGCYQYPFEFTVPEQLPPSFAYSVANRIDYFLKATVSRPGMSSNCRAIMALHHIPSVPFRNESWSVDSKVVHVLVDPRQVAVPLHQVSIAALNRELAQTIVPPRLCASLPAKSAGDANDTPAAPAQSRSLIVVPKKSPPAAPDAGFRREDLNRPWWSFMHKLRGHKAYNLELEAWYMPDGLILGESLPLKLFLCVPSAMPALQVTMLRVSFEIKTEIRAQGQDSKETRDLELLRIDRPVRLATSPVLDLSHLLRDLRVPYELPPSFRGRTMRRSYRLKVVLRVNSSISRTTAVFRNDVKVYSNVETEALPLYQPQELSVLPVYDSITV